MISCFLQKLITVFNEECLFPQCFYIIDQIKCGNVFCCSTTCIKNFAHPDFILIPQCMRNFIYEFLTKELGWGVPVRLEPCNDLTGNWLASCNGSSAFHWIVREIVDYPHAIFLSHHLCTPVNTFIFF